MSKRHVKTVFCAAILISFCILSLDLCLADENIGFAQRTWRRIWNRFSPKKQETEPKEEEPAVRGAAVAAGQVVKPVPVEEVTEPHEAVVPEEAMEESVAIEEKTAEPVPAAPEKPVEPEKTEPKRVPLSGRPSEELIDILRDELERWGDEAASFVPQLRKKADIEGRSHYVYVDATLGEKEFEDLPRAKLESLYTRVRQTVTRLSQERIQRQLDSIRRVQDIQRITTPPQVPTVVTPPQTPNIPKTPQPPPQPPQQRR